MKKYLVLLFLLSACGTEPSLSLRERLSIAWRKNPQVGDCVMFYPAMPDYALTGRVGQVQQSGLQFYVYIPLGGYVYMRSVEDVFIMEDVECP